MQHLSPFQDPFQSPIHVDLSLDVHFAPLINRDEADIACIERGNLHLCRYRLRSDSVLVSAIQVWLGLPETPSENDDKLQSRSSP